MTRVLSLGLLAFAAGFSTPAFAFIVGSPGFPTCWPADGGSVQTDNVTREGAAK